MLQIGLCEEAGGGGGQKTSQHEAPGECERSISGVLAPLSTTHILGTLGLDPGDSGSESSSALKCCVASG